MNLKKSIIILEGQVIHRCKHFELMIDHSLHCSQLPGCSTFDANLVQFCSVLSFEHPMNVRTPCQHVRVSVPTVVTVSSTTSAMCFGPGHLGMMEWTDFSFSHILYFPGALLAIVECMWSISLQKTAPQY